MFSNQEANSAQIAPIPRRRRFLKMLCQLQNGELGEQGIDRAFLNLTDTQTCIDYYDQIIQNHAEESNDPVLRTVYAALQQPHADLHHLEEMLLTILPQPVGRLSKVQDIVTAQNVVYYDVTDPVEIVWLRRRSPSAQAIRPYPISHHLAFHLLIYILVDGKQFERATQVIQEAIQLNPFFVFALHEECEMMKQAGNIDKLFDDCKEIFEISYKPDDIAKVYRNFSFAFIHRQQYSSAIACLLRSLRFEVHSIVEQELKFISSRLTIHLNSLDENSDKLPREQQTKLIRQLDDIVARIHAHNDEARKATEEGCTSKKQQFRFHPDIDSWILEMLENADVPKEVSPAFFEANTALCKEALNARPMRMDLANEALARESALSDDPRLVALLEELQDRITTGEVLFEADIDDQWVSQELEDPLEYP